MNTAPQSLAQADIFTILGVFDATAEDKEGLLGELQDAIWEEVVDSELGAKLTEADIVAVENILNDEAKSVEQRRNELYSMLVDKIPNLSDLLSAKTDEIKLGLLDERLQGMKAYHAKNATITESLNKVSALMDAGQYNDVITGLNAIQKSQA